MPQSHKTLQSIRPCPQSKGLYLLPQTYPAVSVFIGFDPEKGIYEFDRQMIDAILSLKEDIELNVLIPRNAVIESHKLLSDYFKNQKADSLQFISTPSDDTLWPQDYFEAAINTETGQISLFDLPYKNREGEFVPAALGLACHMNMIAQTSLNVDDFGGDYGGNIEAYPGDIIAVGNTITDNTLNILKTHLKNQQFLKIKTDWLETGHVDEIIAVYPTTPYQNECSFALVYASPSLALNLLRKNQFLEGKHHFYEYDLIVDDVSEKTNKKYAACYPVISKTQVLPNNVKQVEECRSFVEANNTYDRLIKEELTLLIQAIKIKLPCSQIQTIPLPVLFGPYKTSDQYGLPQDAAAAINPNTINALVLGQSLLLPRQHYEPFETEIQKRLQSLGLELISIDTSAMHVYNGGIHCATNTIRSCQ